MKPIEINPKTDLVIDRVLPIPPALAWKAWTTPEHLKQFFVPKPWSCVSVEIDLQIGGAFNTVMQSPEGEQFPNFGTYLEIVEEKRLIFTDTLLPGFRPAPKPFFTAVFELTPVPEGVRYRAIAMHRDEEGRTTHEGMGFFEGWNAVIDQMVDYVQKL